MKMDVKHKDLFSDYETIKKEIGNGRWEGITEHDVTYSYDSTTATTNIVVKFTDRNCHTHICTLRHNPDLRIDWAPEKEVVSIIYRFEGKFEKALKHRSFTKYLSHFHNNFYSSVAKIKGNQFVFYSDLKNALDDFIYLIDTDIASFKPLEWFYTTQNLSFKKVKELDEYIHNLFNRIKEEADNNRWPELSSSHFYYSETYDCFREKHLNLLFHFDGVFDLKIGLNVVRIHSEYFVEIYVDNGRGCNIYSPMLRSSKKVIHDLLNLFKEFMGTLKCPKEDKRIRVFTWRISFSPPLEESFEYFCRILDDLFEQLHNFRFQIPETHSDKEPCGWVKEAINKLEGSLNTNFEFLTEPTEEADVNERLKRIYVWKEKPSSKVERIGISNCATLLNLRSLRDLDL